MLPVIFNFKRKHQNYTHNTAPDDKTDIFPAAGSAGRRRQAKRHLTALCRVILCRLSEETREARNQV